MYESKTAPFEPGGALVLYTDALIETPRDPHPILSPGSLQQLLSASSGISAGEMQERIISALFSEPKLELEDDLTLIVAAHTGEGMGASLDYEI